MSEDRLATALRPFFPPRSYMPITQAAKETQLEPDTVEGKVQGVGN